MNTEYTIKNFRVFDEEGATIKLKPISIFTGCNSSGKSSVVKSMVLLQSALRSFKKVRDNIDTKGCVLDFTIKPNNLLGGFNKVLNNNSDCKTITFQYTVHSLLLTEDVKVELEFKTKENDILNNGYLSKYTIKNIDDKVIYSECESKMGIEDKIRNWNLIEKNFIRLAEFIPVLKKFDAFNEAKDYDTSEERENEKKLAEENFKKKKKKYGSLSFAKDYRYLLDGGLSLTQDDINILNNFSEKFNEYGTIYYLPILDKLKDLTPDNIKEFLYNYIDNTNRKIYCGFCGGDITKYKLDIENQRKILKDFANKIIEDFSNSGCKSFFDYYKEKSTNNITFSNPIKWHFSYISSLYSYDAIKNNAFIYRTIFEEDDEEDCKNKLISNVIKSIEKDDITLSILFEFMAALEIAKKERDYLYYRDANHSYYSFLEMFDDFIKIFIEHTLIYSIYQDININYTSSSLVNIKRLYSFDNNDEFTLLLKEHSNLRTKFYNEQGIKGIRILEDFEPCSFINKWIKSFGIGERIEICPDKEGLGITLRLYKDENDKEGSLLAEQGYGITQLFTILLKIEITIMKTELLYQTSNTPYPLFYIFSDDLRIDVVKRITLAIEEPEVHLHPKYQSMLAEMIVDAYKNYGVHFIIETHSEYLIRKLQTLVAKKEVKNTDISLVYFNEHNKEDRPAYVPQVKHIEIKENGKLADKFGTGFFDEASLLSTELLTSNIPQK